MKRMLLVVMMAFSMGAAHASEKSTTELSPAPAELCGAGQQAVTPAQQREPSGETLACFPQPCTRCYAKINTCKAACNGDPECILDCDSFNECQYCCY